MRRGAGRSPSVARGRSTARRASGTWRTRRVAWRTASGTFGDSSVLLEGRFGRQSEHTPAFARDAPRRARDSNEGENMSGHASLQAVIADKGRSIVVDDAGWLALLDEAMRATR